MKRTVAIVGRPNVGKSTLFNRIIGKKKAIVDDISGVTRDRQYNYAEWLGKEFIVVDTGGYVKKHEDVFQKEIKKQVEFAVNEADVIVFVVDNTVGVTSFDEDFARYLRKSKKAIIVVPNKTDNFLKINDSYEFYKLGFETVITVSAINGTGTGDLLDEIIALLPPDEKSEEEIPVVDVPRISIIGKPNVGKSTLVNALLGEERNIVSDIPGTTRDSIHTHYKKFNKEFVLIDTAGLRKKNKVTDNVEFYSTLRAIRSIDDSDVCILMIDANDGLQGQDQSIISLIEKRRKGIVILLNKWDTIEKDTNTASNYIKSLKQKIAPFNDIPVITVSALNKTRIFNALDQAIAVYKKQRKKISTSELNNYMLKMIEKNQPPSVKGRFIKIKYVTQIDATFPFFAFFCNNPHYIRDSYRNYLENKLREQFDFEGATIVLSFRKK